MKITKVDIKRFRSINNLSLDISNTSNLVTICGQNNVGKTNVLRAIKLFFKPLEFNYRQDIPEFKQMTGGASVYPIIIITFNQNNVIWRITKDFNPIKISEDSVLNHSITGKKNNIEITEKEILKELSKIHFFYLPSINISFPELINYIIDDQFLDIEFGKSRMSGKKKEVKDSLEKAKNTLQEILDDLTESINPSFNEFQENWGIKFEVPKNINNFREIINKEIDFIITDDTHTPIHSKGAGLQRLGHMLIVFRIIEKLNLKNKNCIVLIDEPDIYLHYKLQKKLNEKIKHINDNSQLFLTTHSPIFINPYKLENLFLLNLEVEKKESIRKNQIGSILSTLKVDLTKDDSVYTVKEILGIEDKDSFVVGRNNLLVEGLEDKKYLEELIGLFDLPMPNMISAGGVTNFIKLIEYYEAICENDDEKITFKLLFDNDEAGREQFQKIDKKVKKDIFKNINVELIFITDFENTTFPKDKPNIEIEDFIYPDIILENSNKVFKTKRGFNKISESTFKKQIGNISIRYNGVLDIIDRLKNLRNDKEGLTFSTKESGFKGALANLFSLKGDNVLIKKIYELDVKYPEVKKFLIKLTND